MNAIRSFRSSKAFTLIELLIVITIIGILAVALLPRITAGPGKARDAQRKADLQQLATALALYADDKSGVYPSTAGCVSTLFASGGTYPLTSYMTLLPNDPQSKAVGTTACSSGYAYWPTKDGFFVAAALETTTTYGTGIYDVSNFSTSSITTSTSTSDYLKSTGTMGAKACSTTCTAPHYVVSR